LHWAAFAGSELSLGYILAWDAKVNATDAKGQTPLHLAVKSAEDLRSTKSIKHLLIKGADKSIKDLTGKKPVDFINEFRSIKENS